MAEVRRGFEFEVGGGFQRERLTNRNRWEKENGSVGLKWNKVRKT